MKKSKVSIVVPVYNVASFIDRCIQSLLCQTYDNLEILLINDGSTDNSLEIIKKYSKENPNIIKVYSHSNHGPGYTRNRGLSLASGDYITFVDSDDYVESNYIEILVSNVKGYDCSFVGHTKVTEGGKVLSINPLDDSSWAKYKYSATWGKLYNLKYLINREIKYPNYKIGEDLFFNILVIASGARINTCDYCGYNYVQNKSSITNTVKKKYDMLPVLQDLNEVIVTKYNVNNLKDLNQFYIKTMLFSIILQRKILSSNEMNEEFNKTISWIKSIGGNLKLFNYKLEPLNVKFIVNFFYIGYHLKLNMLFFKFIKFF